MRASELGLADSRFVFHPQTHVIDMIPAGSIDVPGAGVFFVEVRATPGCRIPPAGSGALTKRVRTAQVEIECRPHGADICDPRGRGCPVDMETIRGTAGNVMVSRLVFNPEAEIFTMLVVKIDLGW